MKINPKSLENLTDKYRFKKGDTHTDEWKEKHRQRMLGKNNPFFGKKHSIETIEKMRLKKVGIVGDKSNNWHGGISDLKKLIKQNFKYRQWRSDIFTRDNWTCQNCKKKIRNIEAHHIEELAVILKEYKITTLEQALECEKLWDINNGVTLCKECHETKHVKLKNLKNRPSSNM